MLNLSNLLKIIIIALLLWFCFELQYVRENNWCSTEIDILKSQLSDIWYDLGLEDES